jgi:hypothetical protein
MEALLRTFLKISMKRNQSSQSSTSNGMENRVGGLTPTFSVMAEAFKFGRFAKSKR